MLDVPVPLMEDQLLVDAFALHDIRVPEQAVEVPKIPIDELSVRTSVREPQLAEQLVEVPTTLSFSSLQEIVEQNVDFPVQCARSSRFSPRTGFNNVASLSLERISERNVEQIVDSPLFGGGLQDFRSGQGSTASSSSSHVPAGAVDEPSHGVFRTFPSWQKVRR